MAPRQRDAFARPADVVVSALQRQNPHVWWLAVMPAGDERMLHRSDGVPKGNAATRDDACVGGGRLEISSGQHDEG